MGFLVFSLFLSARGDVEVVAHLNSMGVCEREYEYECEHVSIMSIIGIMSVHACTINKSGRRRHGVEA